jgi:hypothetical protein
VCLTQREAGDGVGSEHGQEASAAALAEREDEIDVSVLTGQFTGREAADGTGWIARRVVYIVRTAKQGALDALASSVPGRPGQSPQAVALARAGEEIGLEDGAVHLTASTNGSWRVSSQPGSASRRRSSIAASSAFTPGESTVVPSWRVTTGTSGAVSPPVSP